jgi:ATP-dependent Clp protease protease subunit
MDMFARAPDMFGPGRGRYTRSMSAMPTFGPSRDSDDKEDPVDPSLRAVAGALFAARTVLVFGEVNMALARSVSAQLIALAAQSPAPIRMLVNSPGGHVESGDTIHDVIRAIAPEVIMIGTGWVASAGALIYVAAKKKNRYALPNTRFLLHQPLGGAGGPSSDIEIEATQILLMRERLNRIFADATGQDPAKVLRETERNLWIPAQEARAYGLVHRVIDSFAEV